MQLLIAIVQAEDADVLGEHLIKKGFRFTRLNSVGSFLARGNATMLVGVEDDEVESVLDVLRATCKTRQAFLNALPQIEAPHASLAVVMPLEVTVGGAVVFTVPVRRFVRLRGGSAPPATDRTFPSSAPASPLPEAAVGHPDMALLLAVLQGEDAGPVADRLMAADYRVTRLNTAGGFLRRGNVTLLVGVEAAKVDDVLGIIQANCRPRVEARPVESGMPSYGATVFVLEADRFIRM
ncbi:MAG: cyclic-di-AMP receptor [Anaerolineae bacterium]